MKRILSQIEQLSIKYNIEDPKFDDWIEQTDTLDFMVKNAIDEFQVVYARTKSLFINSLMVNENKLEPLQVKDLLKWSFNGYESWGIVETNNSLYIDHPLSYSVIKTLEYADQFFYIRNFIGVPEVGEYVEISQKFAQTFGIHYIRERNAWCHIDDNGDIESVVSVFRENNKSSYDESLVVLVKREFLEQYAALTNGILVRLFVFTRISNNFTTWQSNSTIKERKYGINIYYYYRIEKNIGSYFRGFQIIPCMDSNENILNSLKKSLNKSDRKYIDFICFDWKNNKIVEHSCSPNQLSNYFIKSDLPHELSPVFFKPEVLRKYKDDSEKYNLTERTISCRDTWYLETYDINEEGQVHTYMIYLSRLPYEELLHWKQFNENPKASISERSCKSDFFGIWSSEYNPLSSLKSKLIQSDILFWRLKDEQLLNVVNYTVTNSKDEWSRDILQLDQLLIEGFNEQWLLETANKLKVPSEDNIRSISLIEKILIGMNYEKHYARKIVEPFHVLRMHRNKLIAHSSIKGAKQLKSKAFEKHGSLPQHFRQLVAECDHSMKILIEAFNHIDSKN